MQETFQETGFLRWRRAFPWLHLLRVPGIAMGMQILLAGFIASFLLMSAGILFNAEQNANLPAPVKGSTDIPVCLAELPTFQKIISHPLETSFQAVAPNVAFYETFTRFTNQQANGSAWNSGVAFLIHLFLGMIICRMACAEFTKGTGVCLERSSLFAVKKLPAVITGFLFPLLSIAILFGFASAIVASENIPIIGPWAGGIMYGLSIPLLFFAVILILGLIIGWPMIIAVIACENSDSFDAWSRSFDYLRSRLIAILIAFALTMTAGVFILCCIEEISRITFLWLNTLQSSLLGQPLETIQARSNTTFEQGATGFQFLWQTLWGNLLHGYFIAYYWCTISAIYILTRHSVDRVPVDEFQQ